MISGWGTQGSCQNNLLEITSFDECERILIYSTTF